MAKNGKLLSGRLRIGTSVLWLLALTALPEKILLSQTGLVNTAGLTADANTTAKPSAALSPKSADVTPEFDVATIKLSNPATPGRQFMAKGHQFITINTTLNDLITFAYGLNIRQIVGGPAWLGSEKYDLDGKSEGAGQPSDAQWKLMIQKLLADRFKLRYYHESRELPVYVLSVGKSGAKLKPSEADPGALPGIGFRGFGNMPVSNATMADFAAMMQGSVLDRPMIDRTGLKGRYDFVLKWTPDDSQFIGMRPPGAALPGNDAAGAPPSLFTAIQEQLGLKVESMKAPVEVFVIDHVEMPSPN
jgi:uncharacterized protein (TIGR03435 family)